MIEMGEVVTLDNYKKYVVVAIAKIDEYEYAYLISKDNMTDSMFCKIEKDAYLSEIEDERLIDMLLIKFRDKLIN